MGARYIITNSPEEIDFEIDNETENPAEIRAVRNAKNLLMTKMGEIPFDRQRGFDTSLYDLPMGELQGILMEELDRVMLWEPYVEVVEAAILRKEENGEIIFQVTIEVADNVQ